MGVEGEYEPGSHGRVLRNLLGISRKREMDQREMDSLSRVTQLYFSRVSPETAFTADFVRAMHGDWLGGIYQWAGKYRTVEVSKAGFVWPPAVRVPENMRDFEAKVLRKFTPCRPADLVTVAGAMAQVQSELLLVHPFREGNGRIARWLTDLMAMQAGYANVKYRFTGRGNGIARRNYLHAVVQGYQQNYEPLARLLAAGLDLALRRLG